MASQRKEVHFFDTEKNFQGPPNYLAYHANFKPGWRHRVIGETTPIYMYWDSAPQRIWNYNPAMKWILVLRNPVDRAFSAWNMEHARNRDSLSFAEAVANEPTRCRAALPLQHPVYSYLDRGYYARQVRRVFQMFGKENCHVLLNEDLSERHEQTLRNIFQFLGVDTDFKPPQARIFQQTYKEAIAPALRQQLSTAFRHDIGELEELLSRDLSAWL